MRDGDPDALAGLCARRGGAVLGYCRQLVGEAGATAAAAEAFASFRVGVVRTPDLDALDPEALLVSATRNTAARHVSRQMPGSCADVPGLLAARADRAISVAAAERLEQHLSSCWTCRAPVARFKAAERAYRDPRDATMPPEVAAAIVTALVAAAPVRGEDPPASTAASNGRPPEARGEHAPAATGAASVDLPTSEYRTIDQDDAPPVEQVARKDDGLRRAGGFAAMRGRRGLRAGATGGAGSTGAARKPPPPATKTRSRARPRAKPATRKPPPAHGLTAGRSTRARTALRATIVLPVALIFFALLASLFVAGVFGGGDPASLPPRAAPPSEQPAASGEAAPDVVVVPGAQQAAAKAVEAAKKRARERLSGQAQPGRQPAKATATATAAGPPPPPPAKATSAAPVPASARTSTRAPAPAAAPAPAPRPAASVTRRKKASPSTGGGQIDADNGATGAEELAPTQDSTTVPDLAPPPDPALQPG